MKTEIIKIVPFALLKGDLSGVKLIVRIFYNDQTDQYFFVLPPKYQLVEPIPEYIVASAIAKHFYELFEDNLVLNNLAELAEFTNKLNQNK